MVFVVQCFMIWAFCNIDIQLIIILIFAKTIISYDTVTLLKLLFTNSLSDSSPLVKMTITAQ